MSNSIWKTPYKNPKNYQSIMFITKNKSTRAGVFKDGFYYDDANNQYEDDELECWATIYDVKAQADKAERLQKQLDSLKKYSDSLRHRVEKMLKKNKTLKNTAADYFMKSIELGIELEKTKSKN